MKHKKILPKRIVITQSDQEDSTQDSVSEGIINVRHAFNVIMLLVLVKCVQCLIMATVSLKMLLLMFVLFDLIVF